MIRRNPQNEFQIESIQLSKQKLLEHTIIISTAKIYIFVRHIPRRQCQALHTIFPKKKVGATRTRSNCKDRTGQLSSWVCLCKQAKVLELTTTISLNTNNTQHFNKSPVARNVPKTTPRIGFHRKIIQCLDTYYNAKTIAYKCIHNPLHKLKKSCYQITQHQCYVELL